jgi:BASS family bile acid:Na+ symporter
MISIGLAILDVAIVLIISALGLRTPPKDILHLFRKPVIIGRALLSMFVFMPACTLLMTWSLPLEPAIRGSLLALSVAPLAPILSGASTKAEMEGNFMLALQIFSALATIVSVPLMLNLVEYIFNFETRYPMGEITWVITKQIVIPLTIGLSLSVFIGHKSERIAFWLDRIGTIALIIGMVMILSIVLPNVWGMMVNGRLLSVIAFTALVLVGGYLFGGSQKGIRDNIIMAGAQRHPGIAYLIATVALPAEEDRIIAVIVLFVLFGTIATLPYILTFKNKKKTDN